MKYPGIADINSRRFYLPFFNIRVPRLELPDHEHAGESIQISAHRIFTNAQRACERRRVPDLSMAMGKHRPEAVQCHGGDMDPLLDEVALKKQLDKTFSPDKTGRVIFGKER